MVAVVVAAVAAVAAVGSGLRVDLIARFVGLPLMFFYARIARIASVSWVAPVLVAGFHLPHNLNIANIQTSPNKNADNILFLFILLCLSYCVGVKI